MSTPGDDIREAVRNVGMGRMFVCWSWRVGREEDDERERVTLSSFMQHYHYHHTLIYLFLPPLLARRPFLLLLPTPIISSSFPSLQELSQGNLQAQFTS
jgi:hypothetical protein